MAFERNTTRLVPRTDRSAFHLGDMGSANTITAIPIADGVKGCLIFFMKSDESAMIRGRVGFAGEDESGSLSAADSDLTLGFHPPYFEVYTIEGWTKVLHLACPSANAKAFVTWFYL